MFAFYKLKQFYIKKCTKNCICGFIIHYARNLSEGFKTHCKHWQGQCHSKSLGGTNSGVQGHSPLLGVRRPVKLTPFSAKIVIEALPKHVLPC